MSLKNFHLVFIAVSIVLAAFVAAWAAQEYRAANAAVYAVTAAAALVSGAGLAFYGAMFQRKMRRMS